MRIEVLALPCFSSHNETTSKRGVAPLIPQKLGNLRFGFLHIRHHKFHFFLSQLGGHERVQSMQTCGIHDTMSSLLPGPLSFPRFLPLLRSLPRPRSGLIRIKRRRWGQLTLVPVLPLQVVPLCLALPLLVPKIFAKMTLALGWNASPRVYPPNATSNGSKHRPLDESWEICRCACWSPFNSCHDRSFEHSRFDSRLEFEYFGIPV